MKLSSDRLRFVAIAKAKKNYSSGQNGNRYSKLLPTAGGLTVIRNQHDMTTLIEQSQPAPVSARLDHIFRLVYVPHPANCPPP